MAPHGVAEAISRRRPPAHPLPRENARLREELARATLVIEIQKKLSALLETGAPHDPNGAPS